MPIILNLYLKPFIISVAILSAMNSDPKVEVSTVFCDLEYQIMGDLFRYNNIPVWEQRLNLLRAWLASTNTLICTGCPRGCGAFLGISFLTLP
jgi:hypothetical protein